MRMQAAVVRTTAGEEGGGLENGAVYGEELRENVEKMGLGRRWVYGI